MKTITPLSALLFLLAMTAAPSFGMMSIRVVSPPQAKEMGMEVRASGVGPDAVWIEFEFDSKGTLKNFDRVTLEMREDGKLLLSAPLMQMEQSKAGHVRVAFTSNRAQVEKITLTAITRVAADVGYELRLKDFVDVKKVAAGPTAEDEARLIEAVRKAFEARDASALDELTCWDRVPDEMKTRTHASYAALVAEKEAVFDVKLADPDRRFVDREHVEEGVAYRENLPVVRELDLIGKDLKDKKTVCVFCFAVGQKDGKLCLAGSAPVK